MKGSGVCSWIGERERLILVRDSQIAPMTMVYASSAVADFNNLYFLLLLLVMVVVVMVMMLITDGATPMMATNMMIISDSSGSELKR